MELIIHRIRGEHADHYTIDAVFILGSNAFLFWVGILQTLHLVDSLLGQCSSGA